MISVIVPAKDSAATLGSCLRSITHQEGLVLNQDYEVILVDDGSQDQTPIIGEQYAVRVIRQKNAGPAVARNVGAKNARGSLLAFTDADCEPSPRWLINLTRPFNDPEVMGVKGVYQTQQSSLIARFVQCEYEYKYARMAKQTNIDFIDTYSAAYRTEIFLLNGGFDESFRVPSVEDQELSFRLARKGYHLVFEPSAVVSHQHDCNLKEYLQRKFGIGYWKAFMLRWIPEKTFSDSHTSPSQRIQILLLALMFATVPFFFFWGIQALVALLVLMSVFFATGWPFIHFIAQREPRLALIAPGMLLARAAGLGIGLIKGFVFPPKTKSKKALGLSLPARYAKRFVDIIGALVGLILLSPVILITAILVRLDSSGPVIFWQKRAGENGKPFKIAKIRTMYDGAENEVSILLAKNPLKGPVYKIPNDHRITRVGRFLRRWSLDEVPQFWNVLIGDMSLVGPRPEEIWVVAQYNDYQRQRLAVKPGLTGPMQVNGRGELDFDCRLDLELKYIKGYSLIKDFVIMIQTILVVISGKGAF